MPEQLSLIDFFELRTDANRPLVMATVFETRGSTYSKAGARMLIDGNGIFRGMLSGGCLEGDLAIRARQVIDSGQAQIASYDLASDDDELWGLGVGCQGVIRVFLQALSPACGYEPFASIAELERGTGRAVAAIVIASTTDDVAAGASVVHCADRQSSFGVPDGLAAELVARSRELLESGGAVVEEIRYSADVLQVLFSPILPVPRVLVLGGGLDAQPVVRFAAELGWRCTVADHRPAYIEGNDFSGAERALCCAADELDTILDLDDFDLAVVMSHHLDSDRKYLRQLAACAIPYVGLLGPAARRKRLLRDLGERGEALRNRVHGPAGLDLGGSGPAAIALSIVAEMQQYLARADFVSHKRQARNSG